MFDAIFGVLSPIIGFLASKYGPMGEVLGYLFLFVLPLTSILIEVVEAVATLTTTTKDDEAVAKAKGVYQKVIKALEFLPHVNIPLAPVFVKILSVAGKVLTFVKSFVSTVKSG